MTVLRSLDPRSLPRSKHRHHLLRRGPPPLERNLGKRFGSKGPHSIYKSLHQIWMISKNSEMYCGVPLSCSVDVATDGVARRLWGRAPWPVTHAMPSTHEEGDKICSRQILLLWFLGDNGSTNWTVIRRDNLFPQLQNHLLGLAAKTSVMPVNTFRPSQK